MVGFAKCTALSLLPLAAYGRATIPPVNSNCTEASSKSASWVVRNFTADTATKYDFGTGTAGKVSFSILNTANGYAFSCLQGDGKTGKEPNRYMLDGKVWYSCNIFCKGARGEPVEDDPPLATSFHFDMKAKALSISQSWGCGGWKNSSSSYTGTGTAVISNLTCSQIPGRRPDEVSCAPVDVTVKATNVTSAPPLNLDDLPEEPYPDMDGANPPDSPFAPQVYPKPGVLPSTPGCNKLSQNTSFQVSKLYLAQGALSFTLKNNALDYTQICRVTGISQSFDTHVQKASWFNCTRFDSMHSNYPAHEVYTSLYYGGSGSVLGVNQTWYCNDEDAATPMVHSVYGEADFPLKCTEVRTCVPSTEYNDKEKSAVDFCKADDLTITPTNKTAYHLTKEQAVQEFKPHGYNCSDKSLAARNQSWEVTSFTLNKNYIAPDPKMNQSATYTYEIEFWYNNTATDNDYPRNTGWRQCMYLSDETEGELDGAKPLDCLLSFEPFRLGFKYDNKTSSFSLTQRWSCDGSDGDHTNFFTATGGTHLPLDCQAVGNNTKCAMGAGSRLRVPIHDLKTELNSMERLPTLGGS